MLYSEISAHSQRVKADASRLLEASRIVSILSQSGSLEFRGSYPLDLMYDPDIDFICYSSNPRESSLGVLNNVASLNFFQRIEYGDFVQFPKSSRPKGYIVVCGVVFNALYWEVETWFLSFAQRDAHPCETLEQHLDVQKRERILTIKQQRHKAELSKHALSSWDIYRSVIFGDANDLQASLAFKRSMVEQGSAANP